MSVAFTERTLGDICDEVNGNIRTGPFGSQLHQEDYSEEGTPVVMPKNIIAGRVTESDIARIDDTHVERLSQHKLHIGDIVYGRRGDIGRCALITKRESGWLCGTGCLRISLGNQVLNPQFLFYYLCQPLVINWIYNQAVGATMPNLNTSIIRSIPVKYPSIITQHKIASILSAYDDLIENNLKRIKILEEMARMIYREWFVNFRFPNHESVKMVDSPLGKIPDGWEVTKLEDIVEQKKNSIVDGPFGTQMKVSEYVSEGIPVIEMPYLEGYYFYRKFKNHITKKKYEKVKRSTAEPNDIIMSKTGTLGLLGIMPENSSKAIVVSRLAKISPSKSLNNKFFIFFTLKMRSEMGYWNTISSGSTMPMINLGHMKTLQVVAPTKELYVKFDNIISPIFDEINSLLLKNSNLRKTRDLLLPKLISGELDVENLDIRVPEENGNA